MQDTPDTLLIQGARLVLPDRVITGDVRVQAGKIAALAPTLSPVSTDLLISAVGKYLLPGFIDIHNHGARGFDFSLGCYDRASDEFYQEPEAFQTFVSAALGYYRERGTTRVYPTSLAAPLEALRWAFSHLDAFLTGAGKAWAPMVGGINLEGTFLKLPEYAGAQNPAHFCPASRETYELLDAASGGRLKIVNVPPEHGAAGMDLIRHMAARGVVVAGGHTGAEADQFTEAVDAGLRLAVHFFNGPSRSSSKSFHDGGATEAILRLDAVSTELIVDGYHVHPAYVRDTIARKGVDRVILITDSMFVNGLKDVRTFQLGGIPGAVSDNRQYLQVVDKADTLFGSVLCTDRGYSNVLSWLTQAMTGMWYRHHPEWPLEEALVHSSRMSSTNPARLLGIDLQEGNSGAGTGSLQTGKWADLVLADLQTDANGYVLDVERVWVRGKEA